MSISKKIVRSIRIVSISVIILTAVLSVATGYGHFSRLLKKDLAKDARIIAAAANDYKDREAYVYSLRDEIDGRRITLISPDGTVLADTDRKISENHSDRPEVKEAMETGFGDTERNSATLGSKVYYCAVRLDDGSVIRVASRTAGFISAILASFLPLPFILAVVFIFSDVIARRLTKNIVHKITEIDPYSSGEQEIYDELRPYIRRISQQNLEIRSQMNRIEGQKVQLMNEMEEREKSEQVRREFSANVSHELKTPLTTILGYSQMINSGMARPEDIHGFTERIEKETVRLIALLDDIIRLSKLDENIAVEKESVELYSLAEETAESLRSKAMEKNVIINVYGNKTFVEGNRVQLTELLYNLIDNAVKYNVDGGSVAVTAENCGLSVSDTGIGIPLADRDRVFERFYRVDKSRSKKIGGTGLGLSIVKHIAMCHNAKLRLYSSEGAGTCVRVEFPQPRAEGEA